MKEFWNNRYAANEFAYGEEPNAFFAANIAPLQAGKILLPAKGEGRNAVFSAKLNWEVSAFDISNEGKKKAEHHALKNNVSINYALGGLDTIEYETDYFDCIGLIYAHFPSHLKSGYHKILDKYLRKGGIVIFEAFSKTQLKFNAENPKAGGPKNVDMLFSTAEIAADFSNYEIIELAEKEIDLNEGLYHNGKSSVIRFVGKKLSS